MWVGLCGWACVDVFKEKAKLLESLVEEERSKREWLQKEINWVTLWIRIYKYLCVLTWIGILYWVGGTR